jgi:hypothetical protein
MVNVVKRGANRPAHEAKRRKHAQEDVIVGGKRDDALKAAAKKGSGKKEPTPKFVMFGRGKLVHVIRTAAYDRDHSQCLVVRKNMVAGKTNYKDKGISPEAALALTGCESCATKVMAEAMLPEDTKRANRKDKRDEVMDRAKSEKSLTEKARAGRKTVKSTKAKDKPVKDKPAPKAPAKTKAGVRSVARGGDDPTRDKAEQHADQATEAGWSAVIKDDGDNGLLVEASRDDEVVRCWFKDGKYNQGRHGEVQVGSWTGTLRGAHAARRQMMAEGRDRPYPEPGKGRSGPRKRVDPDEEAEHESPEDAKRRVPFALDAPALEVIDAIKGKTIKWRNGVSKSVEEAVVPSSVQGTGTKKAKHPLITLVDHPKVPGRRILSFYTVEGMGDHGEVYGGERNIALDKIIRVVG